MMINCNTPKDYTTRCVGAALESPFPYYNITSTAGGGSKMWKYVGTKQCNEFLLSLNLLDCDDKKYIKELYSISNRVERNYKVYKIKKRNGSYRTIYSPNPTLKHIQRKILNNILNNLEISKYAKGYYRNISLKDNALPHVGKKTILKLDIKNFFDNIDFMDVYNSCFNINFFPKSVGMLLTYLCTYNEHIPQGAPTSAYISNLVMKNFDNELGAWCEMNNISYTRYSDDMTFSGEFEPKKIIIKVRKMLYKLGLQLNNKKIHVIQNSNCQIVTGIVVNKKIQVNIKYRNKIRQEIYYINKYGINSHLEKIKTNETKEDYLKRLYGKILFVLQINKNDKEFENYKIVTESLMQNKKG